MLKAILTITAGSLFITSGVLLLVTLLIQFQSPWVHRFFVFVNGLIVTGLGLYILRELFTRKFTD